MDNTISINDIIATKDNQRLRIIRVVKVGNEIHRLEGIDDNDPRGPCRVNVTRDNFRTIIKKSPWKIDPITNKKIDSTTGKPWVPTEVK